MPRARLDTLTRVQWTQYLSATPTDCQNIFYGVVSKFLTLLTMPLNDLLFNQPALS